MWESQVKKENETYGDLIVLWQLEENPHIPITIKPLEFFKYLQVQGWKYDFVSEVDDDSFILVPEFYSKYLKPNIGRERVMIARQLRTRDPWDSSSSIPYYVFPGGQFCTLSWDLCTLLTSLHSVNPIDDVIEDKLLGLLLHEADEPYTFVILSSRVAFDVGEDVKEPDAWAHMVDEGAINPHKMKADDQYLRVAAFFDENGLDMEKVRAQKGYTTA
jgi:hypothetical protein